ncbi:MAG TPA: tRNA dihydrouridine(20/20a) synthase DusA [Gammaproteobacteria bacterium]
MSLAPANPDRRLSVAPMMEWTDRHCRRFLRAISRHTLLYTEMVHANAVLRGDARRFLAFNRDEHPVALQLGGSEPAALAQAAGIAEDFGYDEVNLNVGCPSERVQSGRFGACLMAEPDLVAECVAAMRARVTVPVTVKTRIGIDRQDEYEFLRGFVATVAAAGCTVFTIHARKAWLKGLSPKENREIPPLRYDVAAQVKRDFPQLEIIVNGGVKTLADAKTHLQTFDGVMIGREAYHNPWILAGADREIFGADFAPRTREDVLEELLPYIETQLANRVPLRSITRHMLGLYQGMPGARHWRRALSEGVAAGGGMELLQSALPGRVAA